MILTKKLTFYALLLTIFPLAFGAFGQSTADSYEKLWNAIQSDTLSEEKKLMFLETYYRKAQIEKNALEEYRALEKKSFIVPFDEAVVLLKQMQPLVQQIANDSISGDFLNTNVVLYYKNLHFEEALDYAVQSEAFNEKNNNLYSLNFVRITIGNIYYHTRNYEKAAFYFAQAKDYYQTQKDYNHIRGYISSLYSLGKTYWHLENTHLLAATIEESEQAINNQLKPKHQKIETAYLNYMKGGLAFLQNNFSEAVGYFEAALPIIKQNNDFTNEYVIYLHLGKIAWQQNEKEKAVAYFNKIDQLFQKREFLNYELRETYEYLISYYKENKQPQRQLQATESLIALNHRFENEQLNITKTLHNELGTKKLEAERAELQQRLKNNKYGYTIGLFVAVIALLIMVALLLKQHKAQKKLKTKFNELLEKAQNKEKEAKHIAVLEVEQNNQAAQESNATTETSKPKSIAVTVTEQRLLQALEQFESGRGYLKPVKLNDLAKEFGTNRNTLSALINEHRGNFNNYINKLRIDQLVSDLTHQPSLRKHSLNELAEMYGFANAKTLTLQFKEETELPPNYFIKQLELRDLELSKRAS